MDQRIQLQKLADKLEDLHYVVQRNWSKLPDDMEGDLDLFVSNADFDKLDKIIDQTDFADLVDIRTGGDGYYPREIEQKLLEGFRWSGGFKVPTEEAHFLSLYYHDAVHKNGAKYKDFLKDVFLTWINPVEPNDKGVSYYGNYKHIR